tara:strand:+ start:572 stop:784 length:213 start_codon:yes stop_codon:yes gene_type:complete
MEKLNRIWTVKILPQKVRPSRNPAVNRLGGRDFNDQPTKGEDEAFKAEKHDDESVDKNELVEKQGEAPWP